ncbi:MAG TPA: hypothetical protein VGJ82_12335, partial [Thermoanaerobaculia bacterium]
MTSAAFTPPATMRPALAAGVAFTFARKGVYFRNNAGSAMLEGEAAKDLVRALAPFLDGSHSLAALIAAVPESKRAALQRIVGWLIERKIVVDAGAAAALAAGGLPGDVAEYLASLGVRADCVSGAPFTPLRVAAGEELVPFVADAARELGLHAEIVAPSAALAAALLRAPGAWIVSGCSECFAHRLTEAPPRGAAASDPLTKYYAAALLARTALHRLAGIETADVIVYDAETRTTTAHPLRCRCQQLGWQLPFALRISAAIPATPESLPRIDAAEERYAELEPLVDDTFGPIVRLHEDDFTQLPLS